MGSRHGFLGGHHVQSYVVFENFRHKAVDTAPTRSRSGSPNDPLAVTRTPIWGVGERVRLRLTSSFRPADIAVGLGTLVILYVIARDGAESFVRFHPPPGHHSADQPRSAQSTELCGSFDSPHVHRTRYPIYVRVWVRRSKEREGRESPGSDSRYPAFSRSSAFFP